jgi:hypothetical protein
MRRLIFIALLAMFACSEASAQSRQQSKGRDGNNPNSQSTQPPAVDQRGTDQLPLTVKILPSQKTKEEAEKEERERGEKAAIDRSVADDTQRLAEYTKWLAVFTLALFLGAIGQAALFFVQLRYMRKGMDDAKVAAEAAKAASEAAKTQALATIQAERPYIVFKISQPGLAFEKALIIPDTSTNGRLRFEIINAGKTPAMLEEFKELYPVVEGRADPPAPLDPMKDRGTLLPVGTISPINSPYSRATNLFAEEKVPQIRKMLQPKAWNDRRLFCQGFIRYSDTFGNCYITGFLAAFSPTHSDWALRGGKQYNYSHQERREDIPPHPDYPGED